MRDDPTPPDSVGTVGDDHVRWASAVVDAKAKEHPFDCLVCGSKNVVLDIKTQHVRCRMCGVSTRNVYAHAVPNDRLREMEKLEADVATEMLRQVLGAFQDPHFKRRLDESKAHTRFMDMVLQHTSVALEAVGSVVTRFGFAHSLEGVMKAVRAIQENAGDNTVILDGLERLRVLLSPRNAFEPEEALQKVQEAKVVEEARLREFHVESQNLEKLEDAAQERRRVALMRAKKAARGLDPNQTYAPSIRRHPPPSVVLFPGRSAFVSVVADQSDTYTWCFNGAPIPEDAPGFRGTRSCFLKIQFFTKAMCGAYTCRCSNDDGVIESTPCLVSTATLTPSLVYRHKTPHVVHSMASLPHYCMCYRTMHGPVFGSTNSKLLYDSSSCLGSNVTSDVPVVAMATMADSASPGPTPLVHPAKPSQPSPCLPENHRPRVYLGMANGVLRVDSVAIVLPEDDVKRNKSLPRQPTNPCAATSTELCMATSLTSIRRVAFVGQNAWLLLSDMQHTILLYAIRKDGVVESQLPTHALTCAKRAHVIATSPWLPHFCIMYGKNAAMEVVTMAQGYRRQQVPLTHKPTCVEFAAMGSQVAVGEKRVQHGVLRIVNVETLQTNMIVAAAHFGGIQFLRWIPRHHNFVFSLGHDHTIKLWDTAKKECVVSFQVHTSVPSDVLVTCNAAMECTITVSTFAKQIEKWTIGALQQLLHSVGVEHSYAIVLIQKQWRGALTRSHLR
ncbi:hypothetical protein H257_12500 [Aphanomyces astaci]|uniref:Protein C10 n=1 Tax=Aphanomyces astaci TaxID=112090 RepID=W4FXX0_APHAT|nr:hypothetical protein H257_12500 [Aphanomyces astaci]ETV72342.1 hypothetical protein H257_12500 [Aphanomyces astaci]|eukprot:XP_009838024.1 hypothetical protein H257_12500 [Aphanomyces astaci]